MCVAKFDKQHTAKDHVCTHTILTTFFSRKTWVSQLPINNKQVGCPSSHPTNSNKVLKD